MGEPRPLCLLLPGIALSVFVLAVADVARNFELLNPPLTLALLAVGLAGMFLLWRRRRRSGRLSAAFLLFGASFAFGAHFTGVTFRAPDDPNLETRRIAFDTATRFRDLCESLRLEAEKLALEPVIEEAVARPDPTNVARAFALLETELLPQAHPAGAPGVSLFDASQRPLAWAGENRSLDGFLARRHGFPSAGIAVLRRGAETSLVAIHPIDESKGLVSVEVPIAADRRLENRYLQDYDALSAWAGRSVDVLFFASDGEQSRFRERLSERGEPYWETAGAGPRLFFGLRSGEDEILGVGAVGGEAPDAAALEYRRELALGSALALVLSAALALGSFFVARPLSLWLLPAIWGFRLVLRYSGLPLGLGVDLDNPAHYASSLFFGLARSPADLLATTAALSLSCILVARASPWKSFRNLPAAVRFLTPAVALLLFAGVHQVVLDAWLNSNLALSEISFSSLDPPRTAVQLALVFLFVSAGVIGHRLLLGRGGGAVALISWIGGDAAWIVLGLLLFPGYRDPILLAAVPLVAVHLLAFQSRALKPLRLPTALLFLLASVAVFYPSIARFESSTICNFIESTVTPAVLQQKGSRYSVLEETAGAIDRMYEEKVLGDMRREDLAFAIWASTELSLSSLSSSVEIVDHSRRLVSRFSLSLPPIEREAERAPAPTEWIAEEGRIPGDPDHPGFVTARRTVIGPDFEPWEIRIRVAADWRNLPFIAVSDPYRHLFRAAAVETPLRFPHQELELSVLTHVGRPVFQSVGDNLQPSGAILGRAVVAPFWWEHPHEGQVYRTYLFGDASYVYALSYPEKSLFTYAAELTRFLLLATGAFAVGLLLAFVPGAIGRDAGIDPRELFSGFGSSFSSKLYGAFVLLALLPIASLAFLIRGFVIRDLERDVEREAVEIARVAERFVQEVQLSRPSSALGTAPVTDAALERVAALAGVDVDLYVGGELLATSKPELVGSGLMGTRAPASAQREIVIERRSHSLHRESVGTFEYLVVSVPTVLEPWTEPGILSIPLASRQSEIDRKVAGLNQAVLLAAIAFSLAAAGLAYTLARRIAGPINELTKATHHVAEGSLEISLHTTARDEIGALFSSFNQMTADLKQQREDLEKSKKLEAWAEMARQVAHEVKNPLTPIQLATEHLRRVYGDPSVDFEKVLKECTETILDQVKTLRHISMEFETFASPSPLELEPTDISALVRDTVTAYVQSPPSEVSLTMESEPGLPKAMADRRLIRRTLVNLLENALHALNGSGRIDVRVAKATGGGAPSVEVSVRDNGVGIEPDVKARVFEPYFSTRAAGTGLGLAIAKKVVEDHGGVITLESEPGKGTKVTIKLPGIS